MGERKIKFCTLCKSQKFELISSHVRDSSKYKIKRCKKCHHVQIYPVPTMKEIEKFYNENLQEKNIGYKATIKEIKEKNLDDTIRRVSLIKKITSKRNSILEIGSGYGFFLERMKNSGYKIMGTEVSKARIKFLKKIPNIEIFQSSEPAKIKKKFDVIVMFHVLEHLTDPITFLKNIKTLLNSKGKIVVEVPNFNDYQLDLHKEYRDFFWQFAHIHYFYPKTLRYVFKKAGFNSKIFGVQRYSIENMFNWKLIKKSQLKKSTFNLPKQYDWIEQHYKQKLEKELKCDALINISTRL